LFRQIAVVSMDNGRALSSDELGNTFEEQGVAHTTVWSDVCSAYESLEHTKGESDRIYIAGSLYLVGEFKGYLRMRGSHD
jgi:folylpolyglutamate synthase/dihydropteroate synthase